MCAPARFVKFTNYSQKRGVHSGCALAVLSAHTHALIVVHSRWPAGQPAMCDVGGLGGLGKPLLPRSKRRIPAAR
eukprot:1920853-Alexandrium_andersonii.AAC.1